MYLLRNLQFVFVVFWLQLFYSSNIICLLQAAVTHLIPIIQNLLQVTHFEFFQIDCSQIDLFFYTNENNIN